jgi:hydroxymethylglutaryl-CoA reductase (NADPH)
MARITNKGNRYRIEPIPIRQKRKQGIQENKNQNFPSNLGKQTNTVALSLKKNPEFQSKHLNQPILIQESLIYFRKPQTKSGKSQTDFRKPQIKTEKPQTNFRKPQTKSGKPQTDFRKPQTKSGKPQTDFRKPQIKTEKPQTNFRKPRIKTEELQPKFRESQTKSREIQKNFRKHKKRTRVYRIRSPESTAIKERDPPFPGIFCFSTEYRPINILQ